MTTNNILKFYRRLGATLTNARLDAGLEQSEVAEKIEKSQSYISKIEGGDIKIDLYTLNQLLKLYKIEFSDLLK